MTDDKTEAGHLPDAQGAVGSPAERPVGRPVDEATDTSGPRGTYGCACLDRDSVQCAAIRYGMDHYGEACTCLCHQWSADHETFWYD